MAFFWLINGGDPNHLKSWDDPPSAFTREKCIHKRGCTWFKVETSLQRTKSIKTYQNHPDLVVLQTNHQEPHQKTSISTHTIEKKSSFKQIRNSFPGKIPLQDTGDINFQMSKAERFHFFEKCGGIAHRIHQTSQTLHETHGLKK